MSAHEVAPEIVCWPINSLREAKERATERVMKGQRRTPNKKPSVKLGFLCLRESGDDLLSRARSSLSLAQVCFTVLFGMGRGGAIPLWSPDKTVCHAESLGGAGQLDGRIRSVSIDSEEVIVVFDASLDQHAPLLRIPMDSRGTRL